jgi:hypothetical protein
VPHDLAVVDMEGLAGHEGRRLEIEKGIGDGALRDVEESSQVGGHDGDVVVLSVPGERPAMKMPASLTSVLMHPNWATPSEIARSAIFESAMSPGTARMSASFDGSIVRAVDHPVSRSR